MAFQLGRAAAARHCNMKKKIVSLMLLAGIMLSTSVTAFAADKITVVEKDPNRVSDTVNGKEIYLVNADDVEDVETKKNVLVIPADYVEEAISKNNPLVIPAEYVEQVTNKKNPLVIPAEYVDEVVNKKTPAIIPTSYSEENSEKVIYLVPLINEGTKGDSGVKVVKLK